MYESMKAEELASRNENVSFTCFILSGLLAFLTENIYVVSNYKRRDGGDEEAHIKDFGHLINLMIFAVNVVDMLSQLWKQTDTNIKTQNQLISN